ncbi:carboxylate-amine ligase [Monashia sp. NPDC004114]
MRSVGVEEELLLVDPHTGRPRSVSGQLLQRARVDSLPDVGVRGAIEGEFHQQVVEIHTAPVTDLRDLDAEVDHWRTEAFSAARQTGAAVAALAASPLPATAVLADSERYRWIQERYQVVTRETMTCGLHVHVSVESDHEGVAVIDRLRPWLPVVLALSSNSPFTGGQDSGFASYRTQMQGRWPAWGQTEPFGTAEAYHRLVRRMKDTGVILDEAMVSFDARLSHRYPTVEIRCPDVCLRRADTVLVAAVCRGLVEAAAAGWRRGEPFPDVPTALLKLATWQASREGLSGQLIDPATCRPAPAAAVVDELITYIWPHVDAAGDSCVVRAGVKRLLEAGTGADLQRRRAARTGRLIDVVSQAVRLTAGMEDV